MNVRYRIWNKRWLCSITLGMGLLGSSGCGTGKSYTHDGDPLLGSFNRPIVATPPPTGPDVGNVYQEGPGVYPAPAIGVGLRPPVTEMSIPASGGADSQRFSPYLLGTSTTNAGMAGSLRSTIRNFFSASDQENTRAMQTVPVGPTFPTTSRFAEQPTQQQIQPPWESPQDPNAVLLRQPTTYAPISGSAIVPDHHVMMIPTHATNPKASAKIVTVEDAQVALTNYGVKWQRLERVENGEWQFTCAVANSPNATAFNQLEARHPDQIEAMKMVIDRLHQSK